MSSSALSAPQLLGMVDTDFDTAIADMSTKNLIDTITILQKEMSREQENFNSLTTELGRLKKNSGQYKSISKEMSKSQGQLTLLMNRSMKCFNAQGSKKSKEKAERSMNGGQQQPVNRKIDAAPAKAASQSTTVSTTSAPAPVKTSNNDSYKPVNRQTSKPSSNRTTIQVQSLTSNAPKLPDQVNSPNNDDINQLSFGQKKTIVSSAVNALPSSHSANSLTNGNGRAESAPPMPRTQPVVNVENSRPAKIENTPHVPPVQPTQPATVVNSRPVKAENGTASNDAKVVVKVNNFTNRKSTDADIPANVAVSSSKTVGPMADQNSKYISKSADSVNKPEVVKSSIKPTKPTSSIVMTADKKMMDLDSFTDRKNLLSELKSFDKALKPVQTSSSVSEVKVGVSKGNGTQNKPTKVEDTKVSVSQSNQQQALLGDIKLAKKPSELKENKRAIDKTLDNGQVKLDKSNSNQTAVENQSKLFDDLLKDVDTETDNSESSNESPREFAPSKQHTPESQNGVIENSSETVEYLPRVVDPDAGIYTSTSLPEVRQITTVEEEIEDTASETSEVSAEEDDRYVTEFQFPGKPATTQNTAVMQKKAEAPKPPVTNTRQAQLQQNRNDNSTKVTNAQGSDHVDGTSGTVQGQGAISKVQGQNSASQGQGRPAGYGDIVTNEDGEELVVDTRVKFRDWDPVKVLSQLYEIRMMPDNIEDISHKFIGMEGLMEKLPMNKKKATLLKTWKRRFFRAKDGWLHYYETSNRDKPSDSLQLMGGKVEELGPRVLGVDDGRGKYLMVRVPTDHEYGQWRVALESQTADNVKATYVRPAPASIQNPKKRVIVIDIGSSAIRAGILGERPTLPQLFFPSVVAVNKDTGQIIVGADAMKPSVRRVSNIIQPIQPTNKVDKFNIDMTVMTAILKKVFSDLRVDQAQYLVMISTPQNMGDKMKESMMRILIDELRVRGACMVQQSLLALYSYNATSGIIVDIGERLEILPIYDGVLIEGGVSRQGYGGAKIQDSLYISLLQNKFKFNTPVEKLLVRYICEQACYVAENYKESKAKCDKDPASFNKSIALQQFDLPDGAYPSVELDYACFKSPEGFFNTDMWEMDYKNLQKQIFSAIQQCPMDSRKHMYRSVYLSGGVTMIPGFAERLQEELRKLAPPSVVVEVHASPQRYHSAYVGACAVAGMDVFEMSCVSMDEWKKMGVKACRKWGTN